MPNQISTLNKSYTLAFFAALAVFVVYGLYFIFTSYPFFSTIPSSNSFVYLAYSFLHGHVDINIHSHFYGSYNDLCPYNGRWYMYWPPLCAFLLMPAVLLHDVYIGERWFNALFTAVSVFASCLITDAICKRFGWVPSYWYRILLSVFLAFGSSFLVLSLIPMGSHWYMAQVAAAMMMFLAVASALCIENRSLRLALSGTFWGLAMLSRLHLILAVPFFCYVAFSSAKKDNALNYKQLFWNLVLVLTPVVLAVAFIAWYNWARFGSMLQMGLSYHLMAKRYICNFYRFGYLSSHYLWHNVYYSLLRLPIFEHQHFFREPDSPHTWEEGYSLFYQSPVFLYIFAGLRYIKKDPLIAVLSLSTLLVSVPILCCLGSGYIQFGARYLFDLCPLLFPLIVIGTRSKTSILLIALTVLSCIININGLDCFNHLNKI